jgi:hypothetical protein
MLLESTSLTAARADAAQITSICAWNAWWSSSPSRTRCAWCRVSPSCSGDPPGFELRPCRNQQSRDLALRKGAGGASRFDDIPSRVEGTLRKMEEWAPETDDAYRKAQLVIYPQLLIRVPDFYLDSDWNDIPVEVGNMCAKTCC